MGVGRTCPKAGHGLFGETESVPFTMTIQFNIIRFRTRIINMEKDSITSMVYARSLSLAARTKIPNLGMENRIYNRLLGVLNIDEIWNELAKLKLDEWKMVIDEIPLRCGCLPLDWSLPFPKYAPRVCQLCNSDIGTETQFCCHVPLATPREDQSSRCHIFAQTLRRSPQMIKPTSLCNIPAVSSSNYYMYRLKCNILMGLIIH